jgi:hypothetical protein
VKVQPANNATLARLSREHPGVRALLKEAARLAANLDVDGLRCVGDGQPETVPHARALHNLLCKDRFHLNPDDYVTHQSTLFISICFVVRGGDGTLLVKGQGITDARLADARRACYDVARGSSRGPGYVEVLKKNDADRDVIAAWRAAGGQTPKPWTSRTQAPGGAAPREGAGTRITLYVGVTARDLDTAKTCRVVARVWGGDAWKVQFPGDDELVERPAGKLEAIEDPAHPVWKPPRAP